MKQLLVVLNYLFVLLFFLTFLLPQQLHAMSIYVADPSANQVREYEAATGVLKNTFSVDWATDVTIGPDGNLYVASQTRSQRDYAEIIKIDLQTLKQSVFATTGIEGIFSVTFPMSFGPNGNLYASSTAAPTNAKVAEYDGTNGTLLGTFVPGPSSATPAPGGLAFTNSGNLLVGWYNEIREYNGTTGNFLGVLSGSRGLAAPNGITISPSGSVVVAYTGVGIYEFDAITGSTLRIFATDMSPMDVAFGIDGDLFVSVNSGNNGQYGNEILLYDWSSGTLIGSFAPGGGHGLTYGPTSGPNREPVALCQNMTVSAGSNCTASASIDNGSYDPDGDPITLTQSPAGPYQLGDTSVILTATDSKGAASQCKGTVTVVDQTHPAIPVVSVNPSVLWPPNHKMVDVTINYNATDNCGQAVCKISSVTSNESISGSDYTIVNAHHVKLSADRLGSGNGRIYTITITCGDISGNSSNQTVKVTVPHDQGK